VDLIAALFGTIVILALLALRIGWAVAASRASREQSEREEAALAAASARGLPLEFTAERIRNLDDLPFLLTVVAVFSVYLATHFGVPLAHALLVAAGYLLAALPLARWVRLSGRRAPAVSLAALGLGVVLADLLALGLNLDAHALLDSAVRTLLMLAPAVRPLRLTFRHHRLLRLSGGVD
jgi:hypothetical protein